MVPPGDFGGNLNRPSNPLGLFAPSFPTPAIIGAQANRPEPFGGATAWLGHPYANELVPLAAMAPQTFQLDTHPFGWTVPQGGVANPNPLQHFSGAAVQPLHGNELAARVAAINSLASQPFQRNNYSLSWGPQPAPSAPRYPALRPFWGQPLPPPRDARCLQRSTVAVAPNGSNSGAPPAGMNWYGATSSPPPMPLPPTSWAPPVQQPGGPTSWAPPAQQPGGPASWAPPAQRPGVPAASPAGGSAQAAPVPVKSFEDFLLEAGILDVDDILLDDLLGDGPAEVGRAESDGLLVSPGRGGLAPGVGFSSGPSRDQLGLGTARAPQTLGAGAGAVGSLGRGRDRAAAAEARKWRSKRMAKRKEAAARARAEKLAAARGSQGGEQEQAESSRS